MFSPFGLSYAIVCRSGSSLFRVEVSNSDFFSGSPFPHSICSPLAQGRWLSSG
ncbi:unnamed protein product, partial [Brassica oleracea var. botrytis]